RYDRRPARRRWRGLDLGTTRVWLHADVVRVSCAEHGVLTAHVPWARPDARFTAAFEDTVAWLTARAPMSVVAEFLRTTWRSVHAIVDRVVTGLAGTTDQLAGLRRIGIDEIAYRTGQRYLTCVIDHDTGRLVWARPGRNSAVIHEFFDDLGEDRARLLTHVSADGAEWIHTPVRARAPQAVLCLDPFHIIQWATKAVDKVRRGLWNTLRSNGNTAAASDLKGTRWAVLKNPENLTGEQRTTLAAISTTNHRLYRAYLLKEQLRAVLATKGKTGRALLTGWLAWATRCRIPEFTALAKTITHYLPLIHNTLDHELSNARTEATNTHLRVLTRRAYGFRTPDALISMAMLTRGGLCPPLPGRS
ncbi:MAG: ISL3 family transposase, partial [Pseudonocardiaceae bacterium]